MPVFPGCQLYFNNRDVGRNHLDGFYLLVYYAVLIFLDGFIGTCGNQRERNIATVHIGINFDFDFFTRKAFEKEGCLV